MKPRLVYKACALLAILAILIAIGAALWQPQPLGQVSEDFRAMKELASTNRGSILRVGGPAVEFALPASANVVRLLTNANLASMSAARARRAADPAYRLNYVIEIEETGLAGSAPQRRVHHFRRDLLEVTLPGGRRGTGSFYLEGTAPVPLSAAVLRLEFGSRAIPTRLRVRLLAADPGIADVLLRVAVPEPLTQRNAQAMWQRLSADQQAKLASGNLFPPELLIEQERANLLRSRMQPLGPVNAAEQRDLYVLRSVDVGAPFEPVQAVVPTAGPGKLIAVHIPEKGARVRIELDPAPSKPQATQLPADVTLRWSGFTGFERQLTTHRWQRGKFILERDVKGGWLEVGASQLAAVRILLMDPAIQGREPSLIPPIQYLRAWQAQPGVPVNFTISHAGGNPTPLRLSLRRSAPAGQALPAAPVRVAMLSADGQVLHERTVPMATLQPSPYDGQWPESGAATVSDPVEFFFRIPPLVRQLRVDSADPVLVNASTRPGDLARMVRTPEDVTSPTAVDTAIPAWFALQPEQLEMRILTGASTLLTVQGRPPEDNPDLLAGRYQWEDFTPLNQGNGRVFLAPQEAGVPQRNQAVGYQFKPLLLGRPVAFLVEPGRTSVAARLAWSAATERTFDYTVLLNGQPWVSGATSGIAGEITLPPFAPGRHRIDIMARSGIGWFATHLQDGPVWIRRKAFRFSTPLQFEVERSTDAAEFVSVRLFRPASATSRMTVIASIEAPPNAETIGPFPGWLFAERRHDVRPSGDMALPIAETSGQKTDAGQPIYIPLPVGAPRGRYRITLSPDTSDSWVSVSRLTTGALPKPRIILEETNHAD